MAQSKKVDVFAKDKEEKKKVKKKKGDERRIICKEEEYKLEACCCDEKGKQLESNEFVIKPWKTSGMKGCYEQKVEFNEAKSAVQKSRRQGERSKWNGYNVEGKNEEEEEEEDEENENEENEEEQQQGRGRRKKRRKKNTRYSCIIFKLCIHKLSLEHGNSPFHIQFFLCDGNQKRQLIDRTFGARVMLC
ncbi:hypothetical protein RFI_28417, partial [Reticulomyxa filosa]